MCSYRNNTPRRLKDKKRLTNKTDLVSTIFRKRCEHLLGCRLHVPDVCRCFLDEDGKESIHSLLHVDLLPSVKKLLDELQYVLDEESLTCVKKIKNDRAVSFDDVGDEFGMEFIDLSEFCDTVEAVVPIVTLDESFNKVSTIAQVFDWSEVFKGHLFDFYFVGAVHVKFELLL